MTSDLRERIETLAYWLSDSNHLVIFTGASLSTDSRLADFRGPDGIWTREAKGLSTPKNDFSAAKPNSGHMAIVELQHLGKLDFLISQNVDNLHLKSGIGPELLAELHGNLTKLRCAECDFLLDNFDDMANCPLCGGRLESSVVDFGRSLPQKEVAKAYHHSRTCDLFVVAGSSLVVMPAAHMPQVALEGGARLVIINQGETPLDQNAHLRFEEPIAQVLPQAVAHFKEYPL